MSKDSGGATAAPRKVSVADRSQQKRLQLLTAAAECFRRDGFHSASMAQISKAASMSVGHIYHYFENKEAIIAAIVEQQLEDVLQTLERFDQADDIVTAFVQDADSQVERGWDIGRSTLMLEVNAEAGRNPAVARMVRRSDEIIKKKVTDLLRKAPKMNTEGGELPAETDLDLFARVEILAALMQGLMIRGVTNPETDRAAVSRALKRTVRAVLES